MIDPFKDSEVAAAKKILTETSIPNKRICSEILTDVVMARIEKYTGQKNDQSYMAYRLEYVALTTR